MAKKLAQSFKSIEAIIEADTESITSVFEIGDKIALSINTYFSDQNNLDLVNRLKKHGLQFSMSEEEISNVGKLSNLSIVVSGSFTNFSRDEIKDLIEKEGGRNISSISKKTSFLLAGDKIGPSKLEKAKKLNIEIISEIDFIEMLK